MPKSLFRLLVVLALALTVPVQGIAAVGADLCMALGHHGNGVAAHEHGSAGHAHEGSEAAHHHDAGKGTDKSGAHCPPCASCCATTAIASFPDVFIPDRQGYSVVAEHFAFFAGAPLHRLDRPPLAL